MFLIFWRILNEAGLKAFLTKSAGGAVYMPAAPRSAWLPEIRLPANDPHEDQRAFWSHEAVAWWSYKVVCIK